MLPSIISTSRFVIGMPRPVPSVFDTVEVSSRLNCSKMCFWYSALMPMPVSRTWNS